MDIEKVYSEIWEEVIKLDGFTVPFLWKSIDRKWVLSVQIWEIFADYIDDDLIDYTIDSTEYMYGVEAETIEEVFNKFKDEFLPVLRRFVEKVKGE